MKANDVGDAKQEVATNCSLEDIECWEDQTMIYGIDEAGYPTYRIDHTDGDFRCYHCTNCGEDFGEGSYDMLKSWELVKEHLNV